MNNSGISIITPSYNMLNFLPCCVASVEDQKVSTYEHIIVDAESTDGTVDWLRQKSNVKFVSEKDAGMYDAINKGMKMATGDIIAYLNCDEQYLPGTLNFVQNYFADNPEIHMIFGDALLVNADGSLVCYRKGYQPRWYYIIASHLYVLSCTMFFRRKILDDGFFFDDRFKAAGDSDFVIRVLRHGYNVTHANRYLSTFAFTGDNMSTGENAKRENIALKKSAPLWVRCSSPLLNMLRLTGKVLSGAYWQKMPFSYEVYTEGCVQKRKKFTVGNASFKWPE